VLLCKNVFGRPSPLSRSVITVRTLIRFLCSAIVMIVLTSTAAAAVNLRNDPNGFQGIPWGSSLTEREDLTLKESDGAIKGYERKDGPLTIGETNVEMMKFLTIHDQFARVIIRYKGKANHDRILPYLESQYGAIDRIPGQMMRGLNQQYNWRGEETEINLTYQSQGERGFLSFDSRVLAPRFLDVLPDSSY
jgi:hypothetical protein